MNGEAEVDALVERVRRLAPAGFDSLGQASAKAVGFFGKRNPWRSSVGAAREAGEDAGRQESIAQWTRKAELALLDAALRHAEADGADITAVKAHFEAFPAEDLNTKARQKQYRQLRRLMVASLGKQRHRRFVSAAMGVEGVTLALLTWDLAAEGLAYTPQMRTVLTIPWSAVGDLQTPG